MAAGFGWPVIKGRVRGMGMFEKLKQLLKKKESGKCSPPAGVETPQTGVPAPDATESADCSPEAPSKKNREEGAKPSPRPRKQKSTPKKGKHGISVISSTEDLEALFQGEGSHDIPPPPKPKPKPRTRRAVPKPQKVNKGKRRDRNGILVLGQEKDLFSLMEEESHREGDRVVASAPPRRSQASEMPQREVQKDRHGLPILGHGQMPASEESDDFAALLASSLSEKSAEVLLSEKVDKVGGGRPITLKERLKRYPAAQGQLDLHGFTAAKADQTAEHYVRRAFSVGTYTLRLIVGKGLHSEHGAVLPDTISDRLTTLKQEGIVLSWAWEKGTKSKSGSILVYLNNYDSSRHRPELERI